MVAKLEADAALLSHVRQSMRERQTQIDGLKLQLQAARAAASHPESGEVEAEIQKLQGRVRELEAEKAGEDKSHALQLRLRVATLKGIRFLPESVEILPESVAAIDNAAIALTAVRGVKVEIAGHTDNIGDEAENVRLSQQRAEVIRDYLISRGVRAEMLTAVGYGGARPIADNSLDDGRFANRRIDFVVR
jgi:outer membrane protein OmpA-like peptidoglycan-associated protein